MSTPEQERKQQFLAAVARAVLLDYCQEHPCPCCGETDPARLQLHHRWSVFKGDWIVPGETPRKQVRRASSRVSAGWRTVSQHVRRGELRRLKRELPKCDPACVPTHKLLDKPEQWYLRSVGRERGTVIKEWAHTLIADEGRKPTRADVRRFIGETWGGPIPFRWPNEDEMEAELRIYWERAAEVQAFADYHHEQLSPLFPRGEQVSESLDHFPCSAVPGILAAKHENAGPTRTV